MRAAWVWRRRRCRQPCAHMASRSGPCATLYLCWPAPVLPPASAAATSPRSKINPLRRHRRIRSCSAAARPTSAGRACCQGSRRRGMWSTSCACWTPRPHAFSSWCAARLSGGASVRGNCPDRCSGLAGTEPTLAMPGRAAAPLQATQLNWRLSEGAGECLYALVSGVGSLGCPSRRGLSTRRVCAHRSLLALAACPPFTRGWRTMATLVAWKRLNWTPRWRCCEPWQLKWAPRQTSCR